MRGVGTDYNPWRVRGAQFEQQRRQKEHAEKRRKDQQDRRRQKAQSTPKDRINRLRPEGDQGRVWDALRFIHELRKGLTEIKELFEKFSEPIQKALNPAVTDMDRKLFQRQYLMAKAKYNRAVNSIKVVDQAGVFSGDFAQTPIQFLISESAKESFDIFVPGFSASALEVGHLRIDGLIPARRAEKRVDAAKQRIAQYETYLAGRESVLGLVASELHMLLPEFEKIETEVQEAEAVESAAAGATYTRDGRRVHGEGELYNPEFEFLKFRQQAVARKKGRQRGLLVSRKV